MASSIPTRRPAERFTEPEYVQDTCSTRNFLEEATWCTTADDTASAITAEDPTQALNC